MKTIQAFEASDGNIYQNAEQCKEQEFYLQWQLKINEFFQSDLCPYKSNIQAAIVRKTIVAWEAFKEGVAK